jgi:hypothetical protein
VLGLLVGQGSNIGVVAFLVLRYIKGRYPFEGLDYACGGGGKWVTIGVGTWQMLLEDALLCYVEND